MAIISSDEITLTRVDDGDDGYSPQVTVTQNTQDTDSVDINVEVKDNQTGVITTNTTTIKKADRVYTALQDVSVFNQLTNGGELQGMFTDESGHAYFNGQYLRAEGADIGGWKIQSKLMYTYADKSYQVEEGDEIVEEIGRRFTVINGEAEFYDTYNAATVNTYQTLYEGLSPATPAFAAGIDGVMPSEWDEATQSYIYHDYELGDINTARVKIMHDGSIYAGRYSASNALGYDYNFKVDDEKMILGKNGHYFSVKSLGDDYPMLGNGVMLESNEMVAVVAGAYNSSNKFIGKELYANCGDVRFDFNTSSASGMIRLASNGIFVSNNYGLRNITADPKVLTTWGTYSAVNTTVPLNESYKAYRFLLIRIGAESENPAMGGMSLMVLPTSIITSSGSQFQHGWYQGTAWQSLKFQFPDEYTVKIVGRSGNQSGLRHVYGFN